MLAILFNALKALPLRVYLFGAGLLAVLVYVLSLKAQVAMRDHTIQNLREQSNVLVLRLEQADNAIKLQNSNIEAWKKLGEVKQQEVASAQASASKLKTDNAQAIEQLKQAQVPSNSDQALGWLAMNYNAWASKVAK